MVKESLFKVVLSAGDVDLKGERKEGRKQMYRMKRWMGILLVLTLMLGLFPAWGGIVEAAPKELVSHNAEEIRKALMEDGDVNIKLNGYAAVTYNNSTRKFFAELGSGKKTFDLNGYKFEVNINFSSSTYAGIGTQFYMFRIGSGSSLTINDSSQKGDGELNFGGRMFDATEWHGLPEVHSGDEMHRNYFYVDGGDLILNGGRNYTRSKKQWVMDGCHVKYLYNDFSLARTHRFDGYVRQNINCVAIDLSKGNVTVNGGHWNARGYRIQTTEAPSGATQGSHFIKEYKRAAVIYQTGGNVKINNGTFEGRSDADVIQNHAGSIRIMAGNFYNHKNDRILIPTPYVFGDLGKCTIYMNGSYGKIGVPVSALDPDKMNIYRSGKKISPSDWTAGNLTNTTESFRVVPKTDIITPAFDTSGTEIKEINWDMEGDSTFYINDDSYWDPDEVRSSKQGFVFVSDETGVMPAVSINGSKYSEGGGIGKIINTYTIRDTDRKDGRVYVDLKNVLPSDAHLGQSFMLQVSNNHVLYLGSGKVARKAAFRKIIKVNLDTRKPKVVTDPSGKIVDGTGTKVTLTAKATGATGAEWKMLYPESATISGGTFDSATGVATLKDYPITGAADIACVFKNTDGETQTRAAHFGVNLTDSKEVIQKAVYQSAGVVKMTAEDAMILNPDQLSDACWYKADSETTLKNGGGTKIFTNGKYVLTDARRSINIASLKPADSGYYVFRGTVRDYNTGKSYDYTGPIYHLTVNEGYDPVNDITSFDILGFEDLCYGDKAPVKENIAVSNPGITIASVTYTRGLTAEGTLIREDNWRPQAKIVLTLPESSSKRFVEGTEGVLKVRINGSSAYSVTIDNEKQVTCVHDFYGISIPKDTFELTQSYFDVYVGDEVDIDISEYLIHICNPRHTAAGVTHQVTAYSNNGEKLPSGLSIDSKGRITGTVQPFSSIHGEFMVKVSTITLDVPQYDSTPGVLVWFIVHQQKLNPNKLILPKDTTKLMHQHDWGPCQDSKDGSHTRTCKVCKDTESDYHSWDDGTVTKEATAKAAGVMTYTCEDCGATKTEAIEAHKLTKVDKLASTADKRGHKVYYICSDCGTIFLDKEGTKMVTDASDILLPPLYSNEWVKGKWYDKNGVQSYQPKMKWKKNKKGWWIEDSSGWYPKNQWQKVDGKWYFFKADGYMASNEWCKGYWLNKNGSWTYKPKAKWKKNKTGWYYIDSKGWYPKDQWQKIDGKWYYFDSKGYCLTDTSKKIGKKTYKFNKSGVCTNP